MSQNMNMKYYPIAGLITSVISGLAGLAVVAWLLHVGVVGDNTVEVTMKIWLIVSSLFGGLITAAGPKGPIYLPLIVSVSYFAILIISGLLLFDGELQRVPLSLALIVCGGMLACVIRQKKAGKRRKRK